MMILYIQSVINVQYQTTRYQTLGVGVIVSLMTRTKFARKVIFKFRKMGFKRTKEILKYQIIGSILLACYLFCFRCLCKTGRKMVLCQRIWEVSFEFSEGKKVLLEDCQLLRCDFEGKGWISDWITNRAETTRKIRYI